MRERKREKTETETETKRNKRDTKQLNVSAVQMSS